MGYLNKLLTTDETILRSQRQHWAALLPALMRLISGLFWVLVLFQLYRAVFGDGPLAGLIRSIPGVAGVLSPVRGFLAVVPGWAVLLVFGVMVLSALWGFVHTILMWASNLDVVTTRRVIQVHGILSKSSFDSSLEKINDVAMQQSLIGRILGYGTVSIMTASDVGLNTMYYLADPLAFKRALLEAKVGFEPARRPITPQPEPAPTEATSATSANIEQRLQQLLVLKDKGLISFEEYETRRNKILETL